MAESSAVSSMIGAAVGLGTAIGLDRIAGKHVRRHRITAYAALLAGAGAVYPLARSKDHRSARGTRELIGAGAYSTIAATVAAVARRDPRAATRILAAGWASHSVFDLLHDTGKHSLVPRWYPASCAAYDVGLAILLIRSAAKTPPA